MKKTIQFLLILFLPILGYSQAGTTVNYEDEFGAEVLTYRNITNGKHSYNTTDDFGEDLRIEWTGSRWEVQYSTSDILYYSDALTTMNPPSLAVGMWQIAPNGGSNPIIQLDGSGTTTMVLPVKFISFVGVINSKSITLNWQTASEVNNDKFEIQRSHSGVEFKTIGEVRGNGTQTNQTDYKFVDRSISHGVSYYRLKQIDFDGQFDYSKVISVKYRGEVEVVGEFYPNPSQSQPVNLSYASQKDREITVSVYDLTGKLVFEQNQQVSSGENNLSFDFSNLDSGAYIINIGDEVNSTQRKLIIKK